MILFNFSLSSFLPFGTDGIFGVMCGERKFLGDFHMTHFRDQEVYRLSGAIRF